MPRSFSPATAEQVIAAVEAVHVHAGPTDANFVAEFADLPQSHAESALRLATDLGLIEFNSGLYAVANPLCRFLASASQMRKAAVLRLLLESYEPFVLFRERLTATTHPATAAQQTKIALDLDAHREDIKDTLISLGTYSQAISTEGGGRYQSAGEPSEHAFASIAQACHDAASAEARVREQIGITIASSLSREEVLLLLADALTRAKEGDARGAVVSAGNGIESYLVSLASRITVNLSGATGINAKIDKFGNPQPQIPKKLMAVGKYLGNVRNAADHGIDPEIGKAWTIRHTTGIEYVQVACSFIASVETYVAGVGPEI